jgi:hypothetical protein
MRGEFGEARGASFLSTHRKGTLAPFFPTPHLKEKNIMNDNQRRRFERGVRVRDYAETVMEAFPAGNKGALSVALIKELVGRLSALDASRATHTRVAREGTSGKGEARKALRTLLNQISRTARAISMDDPAFRDRLRLPAGNLNAQTLLSVSRSFLAEVTPLRALFMEYGMSDDFLETLSAKIADFESHDARQHTGSSARVATSAAIDATLDALDEEIARFDTIARNRFAGDAATLAALRSARRVEQAPRAREVEETPANNPPA